MWVAIGLLVPIVLIPTMAERRATTQALVAVSSPVLELKVEGSGRRIHAHYVKARVRYQVDDREQESWLELEYVMERDESKSAIQERVVRKYPVGRTIDFFYDARNPSETLLSAPSSHLYEWVGLCFSGFSFLFGLAGAWLAILRWRARR